MKDLYSKYREEFKRMRYTASNYFLEFYIRVFRFILNNLPTYFLYWINIKFFNNSQVINMNREDLINNILINCTIEIFLEKFLSLIYVCFKKIYKLLLLFK